LTDVDRYRGAMLGLAIGDALGAPVEGLKAGHIRQLYTEIDDYPDPLVAWGKKPRRWRMKGLYTDDAQQALALADSLVKCRGINPDHFGKILADMARAETGGGFGAHRGTGKNFRQSVRAVMEKAKETGTPSAGIGALMRVAPVGLFFANDREALVRASIEQGLVTHLDPRPLVLAAAVAFAVARSAKGEWEGKDPADKAADMAELAKEADEMVERGYIHRIAVAGMDRFGMASSALSMFPRLVELPESIAFKQIVGEANRNFPSHKITEPGQGFVMAGGLSAVFIALKASDFEEGVKKAVHLGKDTDTVAAIAGAVLGAEAGEAAIPGKWREGLVNAEQVALRGEALYHGSAEGLPLRDLVEMEAELTSREVREREELITRMERKGVVEPPKQKTADKRQKPAAGPVDRKKKRHKPERKKPPWKK